MVEVTNLGFISSPHFFTLRKTITFDLLDLALGFTNICLLSWITVSIRHIHPCHFRAAHSRAIILFNVLKLLNGFIYCWQVVNYLPGIYTLGHKICNWYETDIHTFGHKICNCTLCSQNMYLRFVSCSQNM